MESNTWCPRLTAAMMLSGLRSRRRFWIIVSLCDEAVDGGLEFNNAAEHTALQSLLGKFGEAALDGVEPRARGRREVEDEARVPIEPLRHLRMLMGGVIVEDHVNELSGGHLGLDSIQEADELLVTMALHTSAHDLTLEHIESSKQRRCAVALVMGHGAGPALLHWQAGLGAIEDLDLCDATLRESEMPEQSFFG